MRIRDATTLDALVLMDMGKTYLEETDQVTLTFEPEYAVANLVHCIDIPEVFLKVVEDKGEIVGALWGVCNILNLWSMDKAAMPHIIYMTPKYRGTLCGYRLIREFEKWGKEQGASEVHMSVASGINTERTEALYERLGYSFYAKAYRKEI